MSIPLPLPDKPGQGEVYAKVRRLTDALSQAADRGERHEAKAIARRLDQAREDFHRLHGQTTKRDRETR